MIRKNNIDQDARKARLRLRHSDVAKRMKRLMKKDREGGLTTEERNELRLTLAMTAILTSTVIDSAA